MTAVILRGDARRLPLPDESVDLICTSPPYFALRSYTDGGEHYAGQIGSEGTPAEYIAALLACTREWVRVLKPSGSLFVNLGDKYAGQGTLNYRQGQGDGLSGRENAAVKKIERRATGVGFGGIRDKSLIGLPWRYALGCIDDLGLILRAEIVWSKPNGLPESVTDRVRRSHEQWFHFTRLPRYFAAVDEIREAHAAHTLRYYPAEGGRQGKRPYSAESGRGDAGGFTTSHPLGKLPGSVWDIASEPLTVPDHLGVDHFAAFPTEWPKRLIAGWSPSGVCTACGEGRRPVTVRDVPTSAVRYKVAPHGSPQPDRKFFDNHQDTSRTITGYACACTGTPGPTHPSVVLDPFGGTGTTALVASALGRTGISIDMSADYSRLAQWRTTDPAQRAKALGVPKPPAELTGQGDLFDALENIA